jgi:hypothetical protein
MPPTIGPHVVAGDSESLLTPGEGEAEGGADAVMLEVGLVVVGGLVAVGPAGNERESVRDPVGVTEAYNVADCDATAED